MHLFTSKRERKLWVWCFAVVASIYASLGLAGALAGRLQGYGIVEPAFGLGVLLVIVTIVVHGARAGRSGPEVAVLLGVIAAYLLLLVRLSTFAERTHVVEYGVVGLLIYSALAERSREERRVRATALTAITATAALGVIDECLQLLIPGRVFDLRDILVNVLAGILAVASSVAITWAKKRRLDSP